ncbi:MAG TPA: hypothetical protein VFJ99_02225 [Solirubrobacterales bacterium]|nr:hypothetical protein [Solirubrobacterales bacterium]
MDDVRKLEAKSLARAKSHSRRRRVAVIRSRTIRGSLALFALLWGIVFVQLASGNDPALSGKSGGAKGVRGVASSEGTPTPAEPVREPAPEFEPSPEVEFEEEPEGEIEELEAEAEAEFAEAEEAAPEVEEPIVTSSS